MAKIDPVSIARTKLLRGDYQGAMEILKNQHNTCIKCPDAPMLESWTIKNGKLKPCRINKCVTCEKY